MAYCMTTIRWIHFSASSAEKLCLNANVCQIRNGAFQVDVSIYLVLSWFDDRVNWTNINSRQMLSTFHCSHPRGKPQNNQTQRPNHRNTTENVDALFIDHLWTPDLYFYNTRASKNNFRNFYKLWRSLGIHKRKHGEDCGCREQKIPPRWVEKPGKMCFTFRWRLPWKWTCPWSAPWTWPPSPLTRTPATSSSPALQGSPQNVGSPSNPYVCCFQEKRRVGLCEDFWEWWRTKWPVGPRKGSRLCCQCILL